MSEEIQEGVIEPENQNTLKFYTKEVHEMAEGTMLMTSMMRGDVIKPHWDLLLKQKSVICQAIESKLTLPENVCMYNDVVTDLGGLDLPVLSSTQSYVDLINNDTQENVLADLYVNYLGDFYGGQYLKKVIPHENKTHLQFDNLEERIQYVRDQLDGKDDLLKDRAIEAFSRIILIYVDIFSYVE